MPGPQNSFKVPRPAIRRLVILCENVTDGRLVIVLVFLWRADENRRLCFGWLLLSWACLTYHGSEMLIQSSKRAYLDSVIERRWRAEEESLREKEEVLPEDRRTLMWPWAQPHCGVLGGGGCCL